MLFALSDAAWIAISASIPPTVVGIGAIITALLAYLKSRDISSKVAVAQTAIDDNTQKTVDTQDHLGRVEQQLNGRLSQLIRSTEEVAGLKGEQKGRDKAAAKADEKEAAEQSKPKGEKQ